MRWFIILIFLTCCFANAQTQPKTVGSLLIEEGIADGLTLFSPNESGKTYLINNCGEIINEWASEFPPGSSVYLRADGMLVRTIRNSNPEFERPRGPGGGVEMFNWEGELVWSFQYNTGDVLQHHDIAPMPNGNILILAWDKYDSETSIQAGRNPELMDQNEVWSEHVIEVNPNLPEGENIVWEWYLWDHLIQDFDDTKDNYGVIGDNPQLVDLNFTEFTTDGDWVHANSLDYNPELDQIIMNSRNLNEIWIIDHSTTTEEAASHAGGNAGMGGDIIYRWGNPKVYDQGGPEDQTLFGAHDAHWLESGLIDEGKIMIFNNGFQRPAGPYSSIDVIDPERDGFSYVLDGAKYGPTSLSWQYTADNPEDFYSFFMSGVQRLSNGNLFITNSNDGSFFEVTESDQLVWRYVNADARRGILNQGDSPKINNDYDNRVFRAYKYSMDYPAFTGKDLEPGSTVENDPDGNICLITSTVTGIDMNLSAYPQPASDRLVVESKNPFKVFNILGTLMYTSTERMNEEVVNINVSNWPEGVYIIRDSEISRTVVIQ